MSKTIEDRHLNILTEMTEYIMDEVSCADLVEINPQWDDILEIMFLTLVFSIGTRNYDITFSWDGTIYNVSKKMPKHLLVDIHNGICAGYLKGIMQQVFDSGSAEATPKSKSE